MARNSTQITNRVEAINRIHAAKRDATSHIRVARQLVALNEELRTRRKAGDVIGQAVCIRGLMLGANFIRTLQKPYVNKEYKTVYAEHIDPPLVHRLLAESVNYERIARILTGSIVPPMASTAEDILLRLADGRAHHQGLPPVILQKVVDCSADIR